jgi:hypothetical protein
LVTIAVRQTGSMLGIFILLREFGCCGYLESDLK